MKLLRNSVRKAKALLRALVWQINAVRHRDPLSPKVFIRLFGARGRRTWLPTMTPRRVLLVRSDEIGDTVTTLALLAAMRSQWPDAEIHLAVKPGPATIFHAAPDVDRVIPWTPITDGSALKRQVLTVRQALRRFGTRGYDLAVLPRWDFDDTPARYLAVASRAKSVVGFAPVPEREPVWFGGQIQLLTDVIPRGLTPLLSVQQLHRIAEFLGLAWPERFEPPVGSGLFDGADRERAVAAARLPQEPGLVVGVGIGARNAKRQWPVEKIADALGQIAAKRPISVQVLGGDVDRPRSEALAAMLRERGVFAADLSGRLSLSESAAAISRCDVFVGNDSGLQHIASALDVPTVVVTCHPASGSPWSDNAPERFGPWATESVVLQPETPADGCIDECDTDEPHCILAVQAEDVAAAMERLIAAPVR